LTAEAAEERREQEKNREKRGRGSMLTARASDTDSRALPADWPLPRPRRWAEHVNEPETEAELAALRRAIHRNGPFGSLGWQRATAQRVGLQSTLRPRCRPRNQPNV
jgi:hypothetical protein